MGVIASAQSFAAGKQILVLTERDWIDTQFRREMTDYQGRVADMNNDQMSLEIQSQLSVAKNTCTQPALDALGSGLIESIPFLSTWYKFSGSDMGVVGMGAVANNDARLHWADRERRRKVDAADPVMAGFLGALSPLADIAMKAFDASKRKSLDMPITEANYIRTKIVLEDRLDGESTPCRKARHKIFLLSKNLVDHTNLELKAKAELAKGQIESLIGVKDSH